MSGYKTRLDRFNDKWSDESGGCWVWTGARWGRGAYGLFWDGQRKVAPHRWIYEELNGTIPDGLEIDHLCGQTLCVNPRHLEAVSHKVNVRRFYGGEADVGYCSHGHELTSSNLYLISRRRGYTERRCKTCHNLQRSKSRAA
jgi:hypothetical protein